MKYKNWIENPSEEYENYDDINVCGRMSHSAGLIIGGELSKRNQFPWSVIISKLLNNIWWNDESGSLISNKHILTNPNSVSYANGETYKVFETDRVKVMVGTTIVNVLSDSSAFVVGVSKIVNHPGARHLANLQINAVAVVTLDREISFTEFIRPVCLWSFGDNLNDIVGKTAFAVGYGKDETGKESLTRKHISVTVKTDQECRNVFVSQNQFRNETALFCVKDNGKDSPCEHDQHLYMKVDSNWYVKGTRSSYFVKDGTCDVDKPTLYEDVSQFVPWILSQIE